MSLNWQASCDVLWSNGFLGADFCNLYLCQGLCALHCATTENFLWPSILHDRTDFCFLFLAIVWISCSYDFMDFLFLLFYVIFVSDFVVSILCRFSCVILRDTLQLSVADRVLRMLPFRYPSNTQHVSCSLKSQNCLGVLQTPNKMWLLNWKLISVWTCIHFVIRAIHNIQITIQDHDCLPVPPFLIQAAYSILFPNEDHECLGVPPFAMKAAYNILIPNEDHNCLVFFFCVEGSVQPFFCRMVSSSFSVLAKVLSCKRIHFAKDVYYRYL